MSDKSGLDIESMKRAADLAEAIATANQTGNGQFATKVGAGNAIISEQK